MQLMLCLFESAERHATSHRNVDMRHPMERHQTLLKERAGHCRRYSLNEEADDRFPA